MLTLSRDLTDNLDLSDRDFYRQSVDPMPWPDAPKLPTKAVAAASTQFRDQYALIRIQEALIRHNRLFVLYGSGHAVSLEPALRKLMRSPQGM